jgi:hypothetical protein
MNSPPISGSRAAKGTPEKSAPEAYSDDRWRRKQSGRAFGPVSDTMQAARQLFEA